MTTFPQLNYARKNIHYYIWWDCNPVIQHVQLLNSLHSWSIGMWLFSPEGWLVGVDWQLGLKVLQELLPKTFFPALWVPAGSLHHLPSPCPSLPGRGLCPGRRSHRSLVWLVYIHYMYTIMSEEHTHPAKIEGLLLLLCGYLSFIVGNLQVIIQLYRSSTMHSLCRQVFYMTTSQSCMLLTLDTHAQRGLQYLVCCVSVCLSVCYHVFCHYT